MFGTHAYPRRCTCRQRKNTLQKKRAWMFVADFLTIFGWLDDTIFVAKEEKTRQSKAKLLKTTNQGYVLVVVPGQYHKISFVVWLRCQQIPRARFWAFRRRILCGNNLNNERPELRIRKAELSLDAGQSNPAGVHVGLSRHRRVQRHRLQPQHRHIQGWMRLHGRDGHCQPWYHHGGERGRQRGLYM